MPVVKDGIRILGAPVGSFAFCESFSRDIVHSIIKDVKVLARVPSLQTQHLIATKSIQHRVNHLLRNIAGGEIDLFSKVAAEYDSSILSTVNRITRCPSLPSFARQIATLPLSFGGLGYRTWSSTADSAFLASYTSAAEAFPTLFPNKPYLTAMTPHPSKFDTHDQPVSSKAQFASRAVHRLKSKVPSILAALLPSSTEYRSRTSRSIQHAISSLIEEAESTLVLETINKADCPSHPWRTALHISNRGDAHTLATIPTDHFTEIENRDFEVILLRRLLLQTSQPVSENFRCTRCHKSSFERIKDCPEYIKVVDLFGNHAISCMKDAYRTSLWHDAVRRVVCWLARKAGLRAEEEKDNVLVLGPSGMRADVVVHKSTPKGPLSPYEEIIITDIRTTNPCDVGCCKRAAKTPGAANDHGTTLKNKKWQDKVESQGDTFMALCVEAGGRLNEQFLKLIDYFASVCGSTESERRAFTVFALQRIHLASQRGVARLIRAHEPIPDGPCILPPRGLIQLGVLPRGPLVQASLMKQSEGPIPEWRNEVQRALMALSTYKILSTIPVVHTQALASAAGAL
jgi:hypothetical protein